MLEIYFLSDPIQISNSGDDDDDDDDDGDGDEVKLMKVCPFWFYEVVNIPPWQ